MIKFITVLLALTLSLTSCSTYYTHYDQTDRSPSSTDVITVEEVLSFKLSGKPGQDLTKMAQDSINGIVQGYKFTTEFVKDAKIAKDVAFRLEFDVNKEGKYVVRVIHHPDAFKYQQPLVGLIAFLNGIQGGNSTRLNTPYAYYELFYNAKEKDILSLDTLLKLREVSDYQGYISQISDPQTLLTASREEATELRHELAPEVSKAVKSKKQAKEARKKIIEALDKASDDQQFKALIARNDRKGAVDLLKKYLPYEDMAPFEKRYWDNYLEIVKHPVPHEERIFVYRGINDDFFHLAVENGEEIEKDTAIKEGKGFVMSTVLVKNQGSWNRRLRSLEAMEDKFIGTVNGSNEFSDRARISIMFKQHSIDPKGSPFLSFTPNVGVAQSFGSQRNSAYLVDPRLLQFNFTSGFDNEKEFLAGLMTFPDEMVGVWDIKNNSGVTHEQFLKGKLREFVENKYGKAKAETILKEIEKNTFDYFAPVFKIGNASKAPESTYLGTIASFFKKFVTGKSEPVPVVDSSGDLKCDDLIKAFWAVK